MTTELEHEQRANVVSEARTWIGTPYHHKARLKGAGVDCAYLLAEVYHKVGLIPAVPDIDYPPDWMLHRSEEKYLGVVLAHAHEVTYPDPGDVVMYKVGRCFAHGAIVVDWPLIIHAHSRERAVVWGEGDQGWLARHEHTFYSLWGSP